MCMHTHTHTRSPLSRHVTMSVLKAAVCCFPPGCLQLGSPGESGFLAALQHEQGSPGRHTHAQWLNTHTHTPHTKEKGHPKLIQALKKSNEIKPFVPLYYCQCETAVVTCLCKNMDLIIPMHGYHKRYKSIKSSVLHSYTQCFITTIFFLNLWLIPLTFTLLWEALSFRAA